MAARKGEGRLVRERMQALRVDAVMTRNPMCVDETATVDEVVARMDDHQISQLLIVRNGRLVGIVGRMGGAPASQHENGGFAGLGLAILFLLILTGNAAAADSANGQRLAERWCAECHVIAPGQQRASDAVPTFAQIGGRFDETALATFLASPHHSRMPNLSLSRSEIADLEGLVR
jgi:mono/diheme cytochrome c family protein